MKTLILVRHAKAEQIPFTGIDFERKLTDSGKKDAQKVSSDLAKKIACPQLFIASTAHRAWTTSTIFAEAFKYDVDCIVEEPQIYDASEDMLLEIVQEVDDAIDSLIIFGHNPGFSQLLYFLSENGAVELPTCGVAVLKFKVEKWNQLAYRNGKLHYFNRP